MIWDIIKIALKKTAKQVAKSKGRKAVGKSALAQMKRHLVGKSGTSKIVRTIDQVKKFYDSEDKQGWLIQKVANQNRFTKNAYNTYKKDREEQWKKLFKEYKQEEYRHEQAMIRRFKKADGLNQLDFQTFRDMYKESFNENQRKWFNNIMGEELQVYFNSGWIDFSIYIPYGKNKKLGIFALQLKDVTSEKNPFVYYQWVRVERKIYEQIIADPTGKNFWDKFYKENRMNPRYLTSQSKYLAPEYQKKWREMKAKKEGK